MLVFEIDATGAGLGKIVCEWEEDAALLFLQPWIEGWLRGCSDIFPEPPTEAEMQKNFDELMIKAGALFEELAPQFFREALARIVIDVWQRTMDETPRQVRTKDPRDGAVKSIAEMMGAESMQIPKYFQKKISEHFKVGHNRLIGVKQGGKPGMWDAETLMNAINDAAPSVPASRWSFDAIAEKITENMKPDKPLTGDYLRKLIKRRGLNELWEEWETNKTGQK